MVDKQLCRIGGMFWVTLAALLFLAIPARQVAAQDAFNDVQIHGFGGWAYGETDGNAYLVGTEEGRYDNADFALNVTAEPMENLSIVAQIRDILSVDVEMDGLTFDHNSIRTEPIAEEKDYSGIRIRFLSNQLDFDAGRS